MNTKTGMALTSAALAVALAGCAWPAGDPGQVIGGPGLAAALVIETSEPWRDLAAINGLIAASARPREHLEVLDTAAAGQVLAASLSPSAPSMKGPRRPPKPPGDATHFQKKTYDHQLTTYQSEAAHDRSVLGGVISRRLRGWAAGQRAALFRAVPGARAGWSPRPDLSAATAFFTSLQQAGESLGTRRVVVIFATPSLSDEALRISPGGLSGATVIITGFRGDQIEVLEWQAALLQAGAARAAVLVPGAASDLTTITRQALNGQAWPAPVSVRFLPGQARLRAAARASLGRLASELTRNFPQAQVSVLGFGDPAAGPARESLLSRRRAAAVADFLQAHGIAVDRLFAAGYGADITDAGGGHGGGRSAYGEAIAVVDPLR